MNLKRRVGWAAAILVALATTGWDISAQISRRAVSPATLLAFPGFFQGQFVVVRGTLATRDQAVLTSPAIDRAIPLIFNGPSPGDGPVELRATFWDIGHLQRDDPRIDDLGLNRLLPKNGEGDWPRPGEVCALVVTDAAGMKTETGPPSLRALALDPESYAGQRVTVRGQFRGRNLYGDLPQGPGLSQWDFVLHSADASLWVTGQRPRGKGFNLDVAARIDTGHWLQITGTVRQAHGLVWIEAAEIVLSRPDPAVSSEPPLPPVMGPAPEVVFSDPADGDVDVGLKKAIRLQFSRDINPDSLKGNVRWHYAAPDSREEPQQAKLSVRYERANRSIEIKLDTDDLARHRDVVVELAEGIAATDGARLKPWTMTFSFGGQ